MFPSSDGFSFHLIGDIGNDVEDRREEEGVEDRRRKDGVDMGEGDDEGEEDGRREEEDDEGEEDGRREEGNNFSKTSFLKNSKLSILCSDKELSLSNKIEFSHPYNFAT